MATAQDSRYDEIIASLTAHGAMFAVQTISIDGIELPMVASAPTNLAAFFELTCTTHKDALFIVDDARRLTYGEVYASARALAGALIEGHTVKRGDRVGLAARNSACWIVIYMAVLMAGGIVTELNGFWQGDELATAMSDTGVSLVFVDGPRARRLAQATTSHDAKIMVFDDSQSIESALAESLALGGGAHTPLPTLTGDDLATILFTSGSTGKSKGAYSNHRQKVQATYNYIAQTVSLLTYVTEQNQAPKYPPSTLLNVPLFHITGEVTVLLQSFALGRKLIVIPKWDAREAMRLIEAERVTYFTGVPLMSFEILTHPERESFDLSSCQVFAAGGAARPKQHVKRLHDEMHGGEPIAGYGLTETNAVGCATFGGSYLAKPDSTGRPSAPLVEIAILDDAGLPVPLGECGEICIRSVANFIGYWENDEATTAAFTKDRFFRSGDIGRLDDENYLYIVDRKKDIIIRGGENITCLEVEAALYAQPMVTSACVFGLPDERFGEIPAAVVTIKRGESVTATELRNALGTHLAAYKVPAIIWISATPLPVLGTGKIDKVTLRREYQALYAKGHA